MRAEEMAWQLDDLQGGLAARGERVENMLSLLKQAAGGAISICEWIVYAVRGGEYGAANV